MTCLGQWKKEKCETWKDPIDLRSTLCIGFSCFFLMLLVALKPPPCESAPTSLLGNERLDPDNLHHSCQPLNVWVRLWAISWLQTWEWAQLSPWGRREPLLCSAQIDNYEQMDGYCFKPINIGWFVKQIKLIHTHFCPFSPFCLLVLFLLLSFLNMIFFM